MPSLSAHQLANPHKTVPDVRLGRTLTLLERAFSQGKWDELAQWDQRGVIDQAMTEPSKRRRDYTRTLLSRLLENQYFGVPDPKTQQHISQWFHRLWTLGASAHRDLYDTWMAGAGRLDVGDFLLDQGANPHHAHDRHRSHDSALLDMMEALSSCQRYASSPMWRIRNRDIDLERLVRRIDRCIALPGASEEQRCEGLARTVLRSVGLEGNAPECWHRWRDLYLAEGVVPNLPSILDQLVRIGPRVANHEIEEAVAEQERQMGARWSLFDPARTQFAEDELLRRQDEWVSQIQEHLDVLLPHVSTPKPLLSGNVWFYLLHRPGAVEIGRRLLADGLRTPWSGDDVSQSSHSIPFVHMSGRDPGILETFLEITQDYDLSPAWSLLATTQYLDRSNLSRGSRQGDQISKRELDLLLRLNRWTPGQSIPEPIVRWCCDLPRQWDQRKCPIEDRKEMVDHLQRTGLLAGLLAWPLFSACTPRHLEALPDIYRAWVHHPQDFALVAAQPGVASDIHLHAAQASLMLGQERDRLHWVSAALAADPTFAMLLVAQVEPSDPGNADLREFNKLFDTLALLKQCGHIESDAQRQRDWIVNAINRIKADTPASSQVALARRFIAAGLDINVQQCAPLAHVLAAEAALDDQRASVMLPLEPLVSALFEEGADLSLLPHITVTVRPMARLIGTEQTRQALERGTATAPRAAPAARRL